MLQVCKSGASRRFRVSGLGLPPRVRDEMDSFKGAKNSPPADINSSFELAASFSALGQRRLQVFFCL